MQVENKQEKLVSTLPALYYIGFNNKFLTERGMAGVHPQNGIPGFSLHFPKEPSYGYLKFEGNRIIPLGR